MSATRAERQEPEKRDDAAQPGGASEDAGAIEAGMRQPGAETNRPAPEKQPHDPPEELEEERRG